MRLERFLVDLLYVHDCVIVPGFGGLVANYRSARLNRSTHLIQPPSKHVGFNRHLVQNDGLLIAHVSGIAGMSYTQAQAEVERMVAETKKELLEKGRTVWEKIGVFFHDHAGMLQFIPEDQENFLPDAFGFSPIQLKPLAIKPSTVREEEKKEEKAAVVTGSIAGTVWKVAAAIAVPLALGAGIWLSTQGAGDKFNVASLNPFNRNKVVSPYRITTPNERSVSAYTEKTGWDEAIAAMPGASSITFDFVEDRIADIGIDVVIRKEAAPADTTATRFNAPKVNTSSEGRYKVIGGAFAVEDNAKKLLDELVAEGYAAHFAGKRGDLTLVAFGSCQTKEEASALLSKVRSSGRSGWIKK